MRQSVWPAGKQHHQAPARLTTTVTTTATAATPEAFAWAPPCTGDVICIIRLGLGVVIVVLAHRLCILSCASHGRQLKVM